MAACCADAGVGRAIAHAIERADWLRRSPARLGGPGGHKEWLHFCVYADGVDVLVNFSFVDDVRAGAWRQDGRLTMLVRERTWHGAVERFAAHDVVARGGGIDVRLGANHVRFADGAYHVVAAFGGGACAVDLRLEPVAMPSIVNNVKVGDGAPINWLVVPRLVADGVVLLGERRYEVRGALAYHDHNWGHFGWGRDFAWEWGYGLPDDRTQPWSLVFVRLSNRAHTRAMMQGAFFWKDHRERRVFRDRDLEIEHEGLLRARRLCKIPGPMALVHPETSTGIPERLVFKGVADGDRIDGSFTCEDVAQVIIPNDRDLGVTVINEVGGRLAVHGRIAGDEVHIDGRAIFEFLGA